MDAHEGPVRYKKQTKKGRPGASSKTDWCKNNKEKHTALQGYVFQSDFVRQEEGQLIQRGDVQVSFGSTAPGGPRWIFSAK